MWGWIVKFKVGLIEHSACSQQQHGLSLTLLLSIGLLLGLFAFSLAPRGDGGVLGFRGVRLGGLPRWHEGRWD